MLTDYLSDKIDSTLLDDDWDLRSSDLKWNKKVLLLCAGQLGLIIGAFAADGGPAAFFAGIALVLFLVQNVAYWRLWIKHRKMLQRVSMLRTEEVKREEPLSTYVSQQGLSDQQGLSEPSQPVWRRLQ